MRCAASRHSSTPATSASRTRPAPGLLPCASRASRLPGSLLAREAHGGNPGAGRIRLALVAGVDECLEAALRIVAFAQSL